MLVLLIPHLNVSFHFYVSHSPVVAQNSFIIQIEYHPNASLNIPAETVLPILKMGRPLSQPEVIHHRTHNPLLSPFSIRDPLGDDLAHHCGEFLFQRAVSG